MQTCNVTFFRQSQIAQRLVNGALNVAYERADSVYSGPFPVSYAAFPSNQSMVVALYTHSAIDRRSNRGFEVCDRMTFHNILAIAYKTIIFFRFVAPKKAASVCSRTAAPSTRPIASGCLRPSSAARVNLSPFPGANTKPPAGVATSLRCASCGARMRVR